MEDGGNRLGIVSNDAKRFVCMLVSRLLDQLVESKICYLIEV
jgi:hypothetical protein